MKNELLRRTGQLLAMHRYQVQQLNGCCDLLARNGDQLLVIKVLADANALTAAHADELQHFAGIIGAAPLVIAERAGAELAAGIVASRHALFAVNLPTLSQALAAEPLFFLRSTAGITARVAGDRLRNAREARGLSIADVASHLGVSRTAAAQYEASCSITLPHAGSLAQLFDRTVFAGLDILNPQPMRQRTGTSPVAQKYATLGFSSAEAHRLPFSVAARRADELILTEVGDRFRSELGPLSQLLHADALVIFDRHKPKDVPALQREEFFELSGAGELIDFVKTY